MFDMVQVLPLVQVTVMKKSVDAGTLAACPRYWRPKGTAANSYIVWFHDVDRPVAGTEMTSRTDLRPAHPRTT